MTTDSTRGEVKQIDQSSYFDCPKLWARLKISACYEYMEKSKERCPANKTPKYAMACSKCTEFSTYHRVVISSEEFEGKVLSDLGGAEGLAKQEDLEDLELWEKRRLRGLTNS